MIRRRIPWLAAILNFVVPGTGYLYVGSRVRFGVMLVAGYTIAVFSPPADEAQRLTRQQIETLANEPGFMAMGVAALLIAVAFAYDAWSEALIVNSRSEEEQETGE